MRCLYRAFELEVAEACHVYNVMLFPYGVLAGGFLSGKYLNGAKPEGARHTKHPNFQARYATKAVEQAVVKYKALADKKGLSLVQLAVAWCGAMKCSPIPARLLSLKSLRMFECFVSKPCRVLDVVIFPS